MGRNRNTSQNMPMEQYSGDAGDAGDSSLIPAPDPQLEFILAEDRRRKAKRRRSIAAAIILTTFGVLLLLTATGGAGWYFFLRPVPEDNSTLIETAHTDDPRVVTEELRRVNCYPEQDGTPFESWHVTKLECENRGCTYRRPRTNHNMPICFIPPASIGYRMVEVRARDGPQRTGDYILRRLNPAGIFGTMVDGLIMGVTELSDSIVRIHISPDKDAPGNTLNGQVPFDFANEQLLNTGPDFFAPDPDLKPKYKIEVASENPFAFRIIRANSDQTDPPQSSQQQHQQDHNVMWNTDIGGLIFTGDYVQLTGLVPRNSRVYGIGEHRHETFRRDSRTMSQTWVLFARNQPPDWMTEAHLYGAHPFVMIVDENGLTHGMLFYNAAPSEITVNPYPSIAWRSIAGVIDVFLFVGPTPDQVIQQYTQLIGRPTLPPRWFLDLHVCFSNIETLGDLERQAVEWDLKHLPWGTLCIRQNAVHHRYETSSTAFDDLMARWRRSKYNMNKRLSYSLLPHISAASRVVPPDVLMGRAVENAVKQLSCVMPSDAVKQTYFLYKYNEYTGSQLAFGFWDPLARDVITAMRNYIAPKWRTADFHVLELLENQPHVNVRDKNVTTSPCINYELPYTTRAGYFQYSTSATLSRTTVCALALHRECTIPHVDIHNAYGLLVTKAANEAWMRLMSSARQAVARRSNAAPVMSSSTFPGSGRLGGHWLGQTAATWLSLSASVMSILEFNWFGISTIGDWICGEDGPGDLDLCMMWANLAAFQPVIRYDFSQTRPTFYSLLGEKAYLGALNKSLHFRKHMSPYFYTQLYEFSQNGLPFWKPLFHLSPGDHALANEYHSFMVGDNLLVAPILTPPTLKDTKMRIQLVQHFRWLHIKSNREYDMCNNAPENARIFRHIKSVRNETPENYVFLKSGSVVPVDTEALTTFGVTVPPDTRGRKLNIVDYGGPHISLFVYEDCENKKVKGRPVARGTFFWEGGVNDTSSIYVSFSFSQHYVLEGRMTFQPPRALYSHLPPNIPRAPSLPWPFEVIIDHIVFFGLDMSRLLDVKAAAQAQASPSKSTTTTSKTMSVTSSEVKVDVKQAISGDTSLVSTRESIAHFNVDKNILIASRISIPLSEGDFSVVLVARSKQ